MKLTADKSINKSENIKMKSELQSRLAKSGFLTCKKDIILMLLFFSVVSTIVPVLCYIGYVAPIGIALILNISQYFTVVFSYTFDHWVQTLILKRLEWSAITG